MTFSQQTLTVVDLEQLRTVEMYVPILADSNIRRTEQKDGEVQDQGACAEPSNQWRKYQRCNWCSCTGAQTPSGAHEGRKKKQLSRIGHSPCFCEGGTLGRLIPSSEKSVMKMSQTSPASQ